ncbi:MAG: hypothetical protein JXR83_21260 [Deltaproteobacteria bacterium]|nr:hypothetical protein [Deltaproteobacteria bacterium]
MPVALGLAVLCSAIGCFRFVSPPDDLGGPDGGSADADVQPDLVWPNGESRANSDPWLMAHHAEIRLLQPRLLALNFVNARSMEQMRAQLLDMIEIIAESSRYHGYADPQAPVALQYQLAYEVDLRDATPPADWPFGNSTRYPRENPVRGMWGFDYEQLFSGQFAAWYGIEDPSAAGHHLDLCALIDRGLVHEVWIYADADVPDSGAAEILEYKPYYNSQRQRLDMPMNRCAGNGCFDAADAIPESCSRSVRIAFFNHSRGPGCFLESLSHGFESIGAWNEDQLPSLSRDFTRFANYRLDQRYGVAFDSWYDCPMGVTCLVYPTDHSVSYQTESGSGDIDPYDPVCGNVHFMPNGRSHYDLSSAFPVLSSCEDFGLGSGADGSDLALTFRISIFTPYRSMARDCMGPFLVYWRQNFPGPGNRARSLDGAPILNWWVYLFY